MFGRNKKTVVLGLFLLVVSLYFFARPLWYPLWIKFTGKRTVSEAVAIYAPQAEKRLIPWFEKAGVSYPPSSVTLIALKQEKKLELWTETDTKPVFIREYDVLAASGHSGPKLVEGDRQVPEGFYNIEGLNPNSSYHLSLKLNFPNELDLAMASREGRNNPGNNIFIHGKSASIGCLAMGDPVIEEIFVLADRVGKENISVIISPFDFRKKSPPKRSDWLGELYERIDNELIRYIK